MVMAIDEILHICHLKFAPQGHRNRRKSAIHSLARAAAGGRGGDGVEPS